MSLHAQLEDPHREPDILIRPIRGDDRARLRAHHARLSPETRYRRFLAAKSTLSDDDARYLVEIDGNDHFALVATLPQLEDDPIVAVARFIRQPDNPEVAEMAIVVTDELQRHGLGAELVGRLAQEARQRGVRRFTATMLAENLPIRRLLEGLAAGPIARRTLPGGLSEMEFDLPAGERAALTAPASDR